MKYLEPWGIHQLDEAYMKERTRKLGSLEGQGVELICKCGYVAAYKDKKMAGRVMDAHISFGNKPYEEKAK